MFCNGQFVHPPFFMFYRNYWYCDALLQLETTDTTACVQHVPSLIFSRYHLANQIPSNQSQVLCQLITLTTNQRLAGDQVGYRMKMRFAMPWESSACVLSSRNFDYIAGIRELRQSNLVLSRALWPHRARLECHIIIPNGYWSYS